MHFALTRHKKWRASAAVTLGPLLIICLMFFGSFSASGQEHKDKLGKTELKSLIATAKTPEEHLRLAAHYRAVANDYLARQKEHLADAKEYESNPRKYPTKPPPAQHCRDWAYNDGQSAKKALALAEMHEAMARDAAK